MDRLTERCVEADHSLRAAMAAADPYSLDLQLALYLCYELHYRGLEGVDAAWEWNPTLLSLRGGLEHQFLDAIRRDVGDINSSSTAANEMAELSIEPLGGGGLSYYLRDEGTWQQMREYLHTGRCTTSKRAIPMHSPFRG